MRTFVLAFVFTAVCALPVSLKAQEPVKETPAVQTKTLCEAFRMLTGNSDDFSLWKGSKPLENSSLKYPSTLQIANAASSVFEIFPKLSFKATMGKYATNKEAHNQAKELQQAFKSCQPTMEFFSDFDELTGISSYRFVDYGAGSLRLYDAAFQINRSNELFFTYPQSTTSRGKTIKPYADYRYISTAADASRFSQDVQRLLTESFMEFMDIRGNIVENDFGHDYYVPSFMPQGYAGCTIEVSGKKLSYKIPVNKDLAQDGLKAAWQQLMGKARLAFGSDYAYSLLSDGSTVIFVEKAHPLRPVASLFFKPSGKLYDLILVIY